MPVDLYFKDYSPPCNTVVLLAKSLGVEPNLIHCDITKDEQFTEAFLKLNPEHTVPTLIDNGFAVHESRAILIYLAQKYDKDGSLYPSDPEKQARVNQRLFFDLGTLYQRLDAYYHKLVMNKPAEPEIYTKINEALAFLDHYLSDQTYAAGDELTVADFPLAVSIRCLEGIRHDYAKYTNVVRWFEHLKLTLPGWAVVDKHLQVYNSYFVNFVNPHQA